MLALRRHITSTARQSIRCISFYQHIPTCRRVAFYELNVGPSPSQNDSTQILIPVPSVRHAIFEGTSLARLWWYSTLNTRAEARDSRLHRWKNRDLAGVVSVITLNRLVSRMRKLGHIPSAETALYGLALASKDSCNPTAMKEYLQIWATSPDRDDPKIQAALQETVPRVTRMVARWCNKRLVKENRGLALQYLEVVTGWRLGYKQDGIEERQTSLYQILMTQGPYAWEHYIQYMDLLRILRAPNALYHSWLDLRSEIMANKDYATPSKLGAQGDESSASAERDYDIQLVNTARNVTIRMLAYLGAWQLAWKMAYETQDVSKDIEPRSWACLLRYPQGVRKWTEEMNDPAMKMLEWEICNLEKRLGIRWEGGEDGHHIVERGPLPWANKGYL